VFHPLSVDAPTDTLNHNAVSNTNASSLVNLLLSVVLCATCFAGTVKKKEHPVYGTFFKEVDPSVTATKLSFDSDSD
jgi:hypothetical protein